MSTDVAGFVKAVTDGRDLNALRGLLDWLQEHASEPERAPQLRWLLIAVKNLTEQSRALGTGRSMGTRARFWAEFTYEVQNLFYFDLNPLEDCLAVVAAHGLPPDEPPDGAHAAADVEPDHVVDETQGPDTDDAVYPFDPLTGEIRPTSHREAMQRFGEQLIGADATTTTTVDRGRMVRLPEGMTYLHPGPTDPVNPVAREYAQRVVGLALYHHPDGRREPLDLDYLLISPVMRCTAGYVFCNADQFEIDARRFVVAERNADGSVDRVVQITAGNTRRIAGPGAVVGGRYAENGRTYAVVDVNATGSAFYVVDITPDGPGS